MPYGSPIKIGSVSNYHDLTSGAIKYVFMLLTASRFWSGSDLAIFRARCVGWIDRGGQRENEWEESMTDSEKHIIHLLAQR